MHQARGLAALILVPVSRQLPSPIQHDADRAPCEDVACQGPCMFMHRPFCFFSLRVAGRASPSQELIGEKKNLITVSRSS